MMFNTREFHVEISYEELKNFLIENGYDFPEKISNVELIQNKTESFVLSVELEKNI